MSDAPVLNPATDEGANAWAARVRAVRAQRAVRRWRTARLDWIVVGQLLFCVVPAMVAVRVEQPALGARWLFATVTVFVLADIFFLSPPSDLALVIGAMPALMLMRDLFLYNAVLVLLALPLGNLVFRSRRDIRRLRGAGIMLFAFLGFFFWLASFALTSDYSRNLRVGEMVLGAAAVLVLAPRRQILATAIFCTFLTLVAIGLAFLGFSDRLSYAIVDGHLLGNPVSYGVPLAMVLVLCVGDGGRLLMLQRRPGLRLAISLTTGVLLLLSTSRASWLATSIDMLLVLMLSGGQRKFVLTSLTVLVIATVAVLQTSEGAFLEGWFQRTFSPDRTLLQKTSGRSDQWLLFPVVMSHAPLWGFGPGTGKDVYAHYSLLDPNIKFSKGDEMAWHSLYLQVGVEVGFIGLAVVIVLLGRIVWMTYRHWSRTGELVPLLGITSFLVVAGTVSGMDPFAGMFLGLAFLASRPRTRRRRNRRPKARVRPTVPKRAMAAQT